MELIEFMAQNTSLSRFNTNRIGKRFDGIFSFDESRSNAEPAISDSYGYNLIHTMKRFVENFSNIYPNIILNEVDYDNVSIPSYMGLSFRHTQDLKLFYRRNFL